MTHHAWLLCPVSSGKSRYSIVQVNTQTLVLSYQYPPHMELNK